MVSYTLAIFGMFGEALETSVYAGGTENRTCDWLVCAQ